MYDVAIIGAGPVGLATAIGLYERGVTNLLGSCQGKSLEPRAAVAAKNTRRPRVRFVFAARRRLGGGLRHRASAHALVRPPANA